VLALLLVLSGWHAWFWDIYRPPQLIGLFLEGSGEARQNPLLMLILMETPEVGAKNMGAAAGLYFTIGEMGGFAGPSLMGWLADLTGGFVTGLSLLAAGLTAGRRHLVVLWEAEAGRELAPTSRLTSRAEPSPPHAGV